MRADTFDEFRAVRYWPQLDGLRVVSIAIVLVAHSGDSWFPSFKGALGVIVFFVISGFLITSLLLREESRRGRVSLSGFYVRRVFRIVPLYMVAIGCATVLVFAGLGGSREKWLERLPYLLTFNGDFAVWGVFVHAWSIGVEEKFYILWPLIAFALLPLATKRIWIALGLLLVCVVSAFIPSLTYFGTYSAILMGCTLAILMHDPRAYAFIRHLAKPLPATLLTLFAAAMFAVDWYMPWTEPTGFAHPLFALAVTAAFPGIVVGQTWIKRILSNRVLAFVGTRTYGIYLFHVFAIDALNRIFPDGQTHPLVGIARLLLAAALSYAIAEVLYRVVEHPMIKVGRRLTGSKLPERQVPADAASPAGGSPTPATSEPDPTDDHATTGATR